MAQEIQQWRPSTTLSLEQRAVKSRAILQCATSPREALEAGRKLIGQWPHAKPADPETYAASLAAVLAQYPLGLVQECVDPRAGLARSREFPPTVACVVEWCDNRLAFHQSLAGWKNPQRIDETAVRSHRLHLFTVIRGILRTIKDGGDVTGLTLEQAAKVGQSSESK